MVMNYAVHALMYSYYGIRASRIMKVPNVLAMVITTLQTLQMVVGCTINIIAFYYLSSGIKFIFDFLFLFSVLKVKNVQSAIKTCFGPSSCTFHTFICLPGKYFTSTVIHINSFQCRFFYLSYFKPGGKKSIKKD